MFLKKKFAAALAAAVLLSSCSGKAEPDNTEAEKIKYTEENLAADLGIALVFPDIVKINSDGEFSDEIFGETDETEGAKTPESSETDEASLWDGIPLGKSEEETAAEDNRIPTMSQLYAEGEETGFRMKVYGQMEIYSSMDSASPASVLPDGEIIRLREIEESDWVEVYYNAGPFMGYAKDGFMKAISDSTEVYAELPVEYGLARTNAGDYIPAYSRLVDVRKYFKVFSSTNDLTDAADFSEYDLVVSMKLSTSETSINEPFYNSNIAMVQYDLLPMIKKAIDLFEKDGYRIVIYDAYRPTSVQQRWFDVIRVHKWVADPSIGMGGVHDRGTALDISLIDMNGNLLEMPTPMHTFTDESSRLSNKMTPTARENMNYMLNIMLQCGFTYINSEWWHFQDVDTKYYLPTDHPIDDIPLVPSEPTEIGSITGTAG